MTDLLILCGWSSMRAPCPSSKSNHWYREPAASQHLHPLTLTVAPGSHQPAPGSSSLWQIHQCFVMQILMAPTI